MKKEKQRVTYSRRLIYILTAIFLFIANIYGMTAMLGVFLSIVLVYCIEKRGIIEIPKLNYMILSIFIFGFYTMASALWASESAKSALDMGILILEIGLITFFFYISYRQEEHLLGMLKVLMFSGYAIALYVINTVGWDWVIASLVTGARLRNEDALLNVNAVGMFCALSILINAHLIITNKKLHIYDLFIIPSIVLLLSTQSRKAVIVVFVGIFALLFMRNVNLKDRNGIVKTIIAVIIISITIVFFYRLIFEIELLQPIVKRFDRLVEVVKGGSSTGDLRMMYKYLGKQLFYQHPLFGIGGDNARFFVEKQFGWVAYLHDNFVELLANGGIVGFSLYYSSYAVIVYRMIKFRKYRDSEYDICLILLIMRLIMDYGLISYYSKETYFYLLLFWIKGEQLKNKYYGDVDYANNDKNM